jgi:hypothetical protein
MEFIKSIFNTSTAVIGIVIAIVVAIILILLGWKPVSIEVDAGPVSIAFEQDTPTETLEVTTIPLPIETPILPTSTEIVQSVSVPTKIATLFLTNTAVSSGPNVDVSRPDREDYLDLMNLWDYFDDKEKGPTFPTTLRYDVSINPQDKYRWGAIWCGIDDSTLQDILQPLSMTLLVDGIPLSSDKILEFEDRISGWKCHHWVTQLSDWQSGTEVELELSYSLSRTIFDGYEETLNGEYHLIISVYVH